MHDTVIKYESLVKDGQWDTKTEKDADILDLTIQIQELKILFSKQSTYQERNRDKNVGNTRFNNSGNTQKSTTPTSSEYWTKEKNGRNFHWCKYHEYWTATHSSNNIEMEHDTPTNKTNRTKFSDKKSLKINSAYLDIDNMTDRIFGITTSAKANYCIASDEIDRIFDGNTIHCTEVKHSTSDDSEQIKDQGGRINPETVPTML